MYLSNASKTGIVLAIIAFVIASFGAIFYLRRRRRHRRSRQQLANTTTTTTTTTPPSSRKNNQNSTSTTNNNSSQNGTLESHALQPQKKPSIGPAQHHAQETNTRNPDLETGTGLASTPTPTATTVMVNNHQDTCKTAYSHVQSLRMDKTAFPAIDTPAAATPATVNTTNSSSPNTTTTVQNKLYDADTTKIGTKSTVVGPPPAPSAVMDEEIDDQRSDVAWSDRPSSLRQAVLDIGGKSEQTGDAEGLNDGQGKTKMVDSTSAAVTDVNSRPTGYTGAWPLR